MSNVKKHGPYIEWGIREAINGGWTWWASINVPRRFKSDVCSDRVYDSEAEAWDAAEVIVAPWIAVYEAEKISVGDRVKIRIAPHIFGTVVWLQPDDWMEKWSQAEAAGMWQGRLEDVCRADLNAIGERYGRFRSSDGKVLRCDRDKLRAIVRMDERAAQVWKGYPKGHVVYRWVPVTSLKKHIETAAAVIAAGLCPK